MCIYRGYQMSVDLILNLLNELKKNILCEPLILFNEFSKFSSEPTRIWYSIPFPTKKALNCKNDSTDNA